MSSKAFIRLLSALLLLVLLGACTTIPVDERSQVRDEVNQVAESTIAQMIENDPTIRESLDKAVGYAVASVSATKIPVLVAVLIKAKNGDESLFDQFVAAFEAADNPSERAIYLNALGGFENPAIRKKSLAYALEGPIRPNEIFNIPNQLRKTETGTELVFDWLLNNYATVTTRMPPIWLPFMPLVGSGCDIERVEKAKIFFAQPKIKVDGTDKQMAKVEAGVLDCAALRKREGEKVRIYLKEL